MRGVLFLGLNDIGQRIYDWLINREDVRVKAVITEKKQLDLIR